jgi:hypothetical protein
VSDFKQAQAAIINKRAGNSGIIVGQLFSADDGVNRKMRSRCCQQG